MSGSISKNFLVFGIIAPIGSKKDLFFNYMRDNQEKFNFEIVEEIRVSERYLMKPTASGPASTLEASVSKESNKRSFSESSELIDTGNRLRKENNNNAILAMKAITDIIEALKKESDKTQVSIISSLKHKDEVELLKMTFGPNLFLIGLNSSEDKRRKNLSGSDEEKEKLIKRDKDEESDNGQQMDKIFKKSDFFINIDVDERVFNDKIERFLNLIHGHPFCTPEPDEFFMFNAYTASTRSGSISRQVGAVIVTQDNEITSTGCNEVPKYGGGHYWCNDENDDREFLRMQKKDTTNDSTKQEKERLEKLIFKESTPECTNCSECRNLFKKYYEPIEFYREEHAEQAAISSCARHSISTVKCRLYCTTLPCHSCIRIIVSSGIEEVFYIEPYSKSKIEMYDDSITFINDENKVKFKQFEGVGPGRFYDLFSINYSSGYDLKRLRIEEWTKMLRVPPNNLPNIIIKFLESTRETKENTEKFVKYVEEFAVRLKKLKQY